MVSKHLTLKRKNELYIRRCSFSRQERFLQVIYHFRVEDLEKDQTENSFSILFTRVRIYEVGEKKEKFAILITPIVSSMDLCGKGDG